MLGLIAILLLAILFALIPALRAIALVIFVLCLIGIDIALGGGAYLVGVVASSAAIVGWIFYRGRKQTADYGLQTTCTERKHEVAYPLQTTRTTVVREFEQSKIRRMIRDGSYSNEKYRERNTAGTIPPEDVQVYETTEMADDFPLFYYLRAGRAVFVNVWEDMNITPVRRAIKPEDLL
jgi:hypothetical protein